MKFIWITQGILSVSGSSAFNNRDRKNVYVQITKEIHCDEHEQYYYSLIFLNMKWFQNKDQISENTLNELDGNRTKYK